MEVSTTGYDMTVENEDVNRPETDLTDAGYEAWLRWFEDVEARDGYFRLNIWGMGSMRQLLYAGDCLNVDAVTPAFGERVDAEVIVAIDTGGVVPAYKFGSNDGWLVSPAECMATALTWFEGGGRERAKDGARAIAAEWSSQGEKASVDDVLKWADSFVRWMGVASGRGGFRVY